MKNLEIIILCSLLASTYSEEKNSTQPATLTGKTLAVLREGNPKTISEQKTAEKLALHLPENNRTNVALIYLEGTYLTSGALITIEHVLYHTTDTIAFDRTRQPSQNYIVKVPSFQSSNLQYNIYRIENKIPSPCSVEIAKVRMVTHNFDVILTPIIRYANFWKLKYTALRRWEVPGGPFVNSLIRPSSIAPSLIFDEECCLPSEDPEIQIGALLFSERKIVGIYSGCLHVIEGALHHYRYYYQHLGNIFDDINTSVEGMLPLD